MKKGILFLLLLVLPFVFGAGLKQHDVIFLKDYPRHAVTLPITNEQAAIDFVLQLEEVKKKSLKMARGGSGPSVLIR